MIASTSGLSFNITLHQMSKECRQNVLIIGGWLPSQIRTWPTIHTINILSIQSTNG